MDDLLVGLVETALFPEGLADLVDQHVLVVGHEVTERELDVVHAAEDDDGVVDRRVLLPDGGVEPDRDCVETAREALGQLVELRDVLLARHDVEEPEAQLHDRQAGRADAGDLEVLELGHEREALDDQAVVREELLEGVAHVCAGGPLGEDLVEGVTGQHGLGGEHRTP